MDPRCVVTLEDTADVLFGYAVAHPSTGRLSWVSSTEIKEINEAAGRARTRSGRIYELGRRILPTGIPEEGEEPWVAFHLLLGHHTDDPDLVQPPMTHPGFDWLWVASCKAARHLGLAPPGRNLREVREFSGKHTGDYLRLRQARASGSRQ